MQDARKYKSIRLLIVRASLLSFGYTGEFTDCLREDFKDDQEYNILEKEAMGASI